MSSSNVPATELLELASEAKNRPEAITILYRILDDPASSSESLRIKEQAIAKLSDLLREESRGEDLRGLLTTLRPFFSLIPKDKTANIVRGIIDSVAKIPNTTDLQISLCKEMIDWTRSEKRTFLRQRVEARLAALLIDSKEYSEALILLSGLVKKVRRLDDKLFHVEIDLLESKLHFSLRNLPKAKAALTAVRTAANAIYVPPAQQGTIDLQSGILHAEEKDYKTAYCYFFEAFEAFNALEDNRAVYSLKYMLLCKIMMNQADDVAGIISSKALKFLDPEFDAMKAVADAFSKSSLRLFKTALQDFKAQLDEDPVVHVHLSLLYATLLEQNMFRFAGTLDQGVGDVIFPATLETMNMGKKPYDVEDDIFVDPELEEDEIIESDIEFEGEIVVPDNDPPQKMGDSSVEVSEENREASQEAKSKAMEAISDGKLEEAIEHLTEAILLNPTSAILYATRASVYIKMKKPNAAIRDADAALQINPDCAKSYKSRGIALSMLGHWEKAADEFHIASYIDFDEEITTILKKVEGNAHKIVEHRRKYDTLRMEREDRKIERERKRRKAEAKLNPPAAYEIAKNEEIAYSSDRSKCMPGFLGGMPSGFPGEFSCRFPGGMPGWFPCGFSTGMLPGGFPFPGGGGGMQGECFGDGGAAGGGMPGGIDYSNISNIQDSELMLMAAVFKDPEAMAAIQDVIENPANLRKQRSNPKAEKLIAKMISKIAGAF